VGVTACHFYKWKKGKAYVPLAIGLFLFYLYTVGPLSHSREKVEAILHLDPNQVLRMTLQPTRNSSYTDISLVRYDRLINDSATLHRISRLLRQAVIVGEGYIKDPSQVGRMEITLRNQPSIVFGFKKRGGAVCIVLDSNGEDGWHYGLLDAPGLGPVLDSVASANFK